MAAITPPINCDDNIFDHEYGKWISRPEKRKIQDTIAYKPGLFKIHDDSNCDKTIKCFKDQN